MSTQPTQQSRRSRGGQRRNGANQNRGGNSANASRGNTRRRRDNEGIIPVLAKAVREVEQAVQKGQGLSHRSRYQAIALLARKERLRVRSDEAISEQQRDTELKRLDGVATILAQCAAREPGLFSLLDENAEIGEATRHRMAEMLEAAGQAAEAVAVEEPASDGDTTAPRTDRKATPPSVVAARLANPFLVPDFSQAVRRVQGTLVGWELIGPLLNSFEQPVPGAPACMELPEPRPILLPPGVELMDHQARLLSAIAGGHRTVLLADEPGLGKTAQSLLAAEVSEAYPLLCVVPNVVKTNWAREAARWVPKRSVSVVHGDGNDVDGFADIIIVNYEVLDRHVDWIGEHGFRGMVVDEAHYIKNRKSQRSQYVVEISERIRRRVARPLLMALTGTPLINDIEDFRAIWHFLGWIEERKPGSQLMAELEATGLTPADHPFYPAARQAVVDMGIVRRRKVDVAADIPARRVADLPVELEGAEGRSIQKAERELAERLVGRYDAAMEHRRSSPVAIASAESADGIDHELVRRVAEREVAEGSDNTTGENVFAMVRRIGRAKAELAADYTAQLARSTGKVVFFAKHLDVMDAAGAVFDKREIRWTTIRGDQSASARTAAIDAFVEDPEVQVIVCSLTAAGVGINLQVASNVVLAELSWTDAEQTQAIDRVHRIGQTEPVTAWRILAAQTIDTRIAELIDSKAGLAARALDGAEEEETTTVDIQVETLVSLLTDALRSRS
ncbi:DEAD/DEAH box helicase [Nocardioides sp.]|uniref:DEAD/DEAH box helicase n=1 Tax=Nocardioides sp. TaxID=35761 RepID=UPI002B88E0FB|nr:DEAD/DEAH box helicase [Nocardioides sp.]HSX68762.1 DEAD/DEAH box helicase [Nocardioides sp.]